MEATAQAPQAGMSPGEGPPARQKVFRPENEGEQMGAVLQRMLSDGRQVAETQRYRWLANRKMYRGEQYLSISRTGVRTLAPTEKLPNGVRRVTINRIRPFVDARIAMFTYKRPDFEVFSVSMDLQSIEARRIATRLVDAQWGDDAWDVDTYNRTSLLYAEQDGLCYGHVYFDKHAGRKVQVMRDVATGQLIQDPEMQAAMRESDPTGMHYWRTDEVAEGDVKMRAVRASELAVDPFARKNFKDARWCIESELVPRWKVEAEAGMKLAEICRRSNDAIGITPGANDVAKVPSETYQFDDGDGEAGPLISSNEALTVRTAYILPTGKYGRWPKGAYIRWIDMAPNHPITQTDYDKDCLPYRAFTPRMDGTHFLKARGIVDDMSPVQVAFNRVVSMLHEWLDLVGRPPLVVQNGVLRSKAIFNEARIINVNGGTAPYFMNVPSEPTAVFTHHLMWLLEQMKEMASQHDASRGQAPGKGIEAAVSLDMLIQQNEQSVSTYADEFKAHMEWSLSEALRLTADHYSLPRLIAGAAGDDPSAFRDFIGARIRGAHVLKIRGPITPKARAAQIEMLLQLAQYTQGRFDPSRWIVQMLEGNVDEIIEGERAQQQNQKREIDEILALGHQEGADTLYQDFEQARDAYISTVQKLQQAGDEQPQMTLEMGGIRPATLASVGIKLPVVEEFHNHPAHIMTLVEFMVSPAWKHQHPLVKEGLKQHLRDHQMAMAGQINAMAAQEADPGADAGAPPEEGGEPEGGGGKPGQEGPPQGGGESPPTSDGPPEPSQGGPE